MLAYRPLTMLLHARNERVGPSRIDSLARDLLTALPIAFLVVDRTTSEVEYWNDRSEALLSGLREEATSLSLDAVLAPLDALLGPDGECRRCTVRLATDGSFPSEVSAAGPLEVGDFVADKARLLEAELVPLTSSRDDSKRLLITLGDVTLLASLRLERDRLMRIAAVSETLPTVLHELKNPLGAIANSVELLLEDNLSSPITEELHAVLTEIRRMGLTLEGLGAIGRSLRSTKNGAIDHALRETYLVLQRRASELGFSLVADVEAMPLLPFDPAVVRAIVFNLLTNSMHACRPGDRILLRGEYQRATNVVKIVVEDTGSGMSPEVLRRATELFFTTKARGSGIGLALCERTIRKAGGTTRILSQPGKGTRIELLVPVQ